MAPFSPQAPNLHPDGDILSSPSVSDQEDEYVVDKIIAQTGPEEGDYDETMYLVRWEGYSDERCTVSCGCSALMHSGQNFSRSFQLFESPDVARHMNIGLTFT